MNLIKIILKGNPQSNNHIYRTNGHVVYMTKEGKDLKESYQWQAKPQFPGKPFPSNVKIIIDLFFGDKRVRDIDNYGKLLLDSLSGILYKDDKQIVDMRIRKHIDIKNPRIVVSI